MFDWITIHSKVIKTLLPIIEAHPGIESRTLAQMAGLSLSHTKNGLAVISRHNVAGYVELGNARRGWWLQPEADRQRAAFVAVKARKRMEAAKRPPTAREQIMGMAAEEDGASIRKVSERISIGRKEAHRHCLQMVRQGRLFLTHRPGCVGRWFDSQERADAWAALPAVEPSEWRKKPGRPALKPKPEPKAPKLVAIGERIKNKTRQPSKAPPLLAGSQKNRKPLQVIKAKPANDAPVTLHGKPSDMRGVVDYSRAKYTVIPGPLFDAAWQAAPSSEAHTGFVKQWRELRGAA